MSLWNKRDRCGPCYSVKNSFVIETKIRPRIHDKCAGYNKSFIGHNCQPLWNILVK